MQLLRDNLTLWTSDMQVRDSPPASAAPPAVTRCLQEEGGDAQGGDDGEAA
jgi:hypothetical protein